MHIWQIMRHSTLLLVVSAGAAQAQSYGAPTTRSGGSGGTSVAYEQPVYYTQRLRPSRTYPPSPYGWIETGRGAQQGYGARPPGR